MDHLIPDTTIAVAALMGLCAVIRRLRGQSRLSHIRRLMIVAAVFYAARTMDWWLGFGVFRSLTVICAAVLPLCILFSVETLLRRHAPFWVKSVTSIGIVPALFALAPTLTHSSVFIAILLIYQCLSLSIFAFLFVLRDRSTLGPSENTTIDRLGLALVLLLPLVASDFLVEILYLPASMSGIAALIGCLVMVQIGDDTRTRRRLVAELAILAGVSALAALGIFAHLGVTKTQLFQVFTMIFAMSLAGVVIIGCRRLIWRNGTPKTPKNQPPNTESLTAALSDLNHQNRAIVVLQPTDLEGFDLDLLRHAFTKTTIALDDLPRDASNDSMETGQIRALITRYAGTRAYLAAHHPLTIAITQSNDLTHGPDPQLMAGFALTRVIAERDASRAQT